MNATAPNPLNTLAFEVPDPVEEAGQDGGKFNRCYDALADELDEDMVKGLKEQLDGMLIFAGLFAGVNSAFLALTLPLLSADSADDIVALLAQNNGILIQMARGGNDSISTTFRLPSADFSPSRDIFAVNALFSLSLTFAIISSFLAVLGRQWLVYYRKRSGGGPERQRWEQLKRFLGAERWRLEPILDDFLPSLLQIGLIIFCTSLSLYLRHLSPAISLIVGIPIPLSHILFWSARTFPAAVRVTKELEWAQLKQGLSLKRWSHVLRHGREEETPKSLQVIALQRAICTSDDQTTLLHATANVFGIRDVALMEELWSNPSFEDRFVDQWQSSYPRILQLRGHDEVNTAAASQRLYSAAAAHIMLYRNTEWFEYRSTAWQPWSLEEKSILIPDSQIRDSSTCLIRSTLGFTMLRFSRVRPTRETMNIFCNYLLACFSLNLERQDFCLLCLLSFITSELPDFRLSWVDMQDSLRRAYKGENAWQTLPNAAKTLLAPGSTSIPNRDLLLNRVFDCVDQMLSDNNAQTIFTIEQWFSFLEGFEGIVLSPQLPQAARQVIKRIRWGVAQYWQEECTRKRMPRHLPDVLEKYIAKLRNVNLAEHGNVECIDALRVFRSPARQLVSVSYEKWESPAGEMRFRFMDTFNKFVQEVDRSSRQMLHKSRQVRDKGERWCYWVEEERVSILATYSLPPDPPESFWQFAAQRSAITGP